MNSEDAPKGRKLKNILCYALYDGGNSNYDTLVIAIAFPLFIQTAIFNGGKGHELFWGGIVALATLVAAVAGPMLGARVDRTGNKFRWLRRLTLAAVAGILIMPFLPKGMALIAGALFVATQCVFLLSVLIYYSALADVSTTKDSVMVSSFAWGIGYAGGLAGLLIATTTSGIEDVTMRMRVLFAIAGGMFLLFVIPLLRMKDKAQPAALAKPRASFLTLVRTFMREAGRSRLFWAFFFYTNGVNTVIYFTAIYAKGTLNFNIDEIIGLFILMNLVAAPSAMLFGKIAQRFGQMRTLRSIVAGWVFVVAGVCYAGFIENTPLFMVAASFGAALMGPVQAISRSLFRNIFPEGDMSSFFGVQALANRSAALVGPLLFGVVSFLTGNQILGAMSSALLFAVGFAVLLTVPTNLGEAAT
jgi:MFS transporter, UMF1 family